MRAAELITYRRVTATCDHMSNPRTSRGSLSMALWAILWMDWLTIREALVQQGLASMTGGERGIRTPDRRLTYTRFPGVRLKPLIHLSSKSESIADSNGGSPAPPKRQFIAATL